jgi:hypothetical protein
MARGVVHWALPTAIVSIGRLTGTFVASRPITAPTHRYSYGSGRSGQRLVATSLLLVVVVAAAAALGLGPGIGLALPLCHLGS